MLSSRLGSVLILIVAMLGIQFGASFAKQLFPLVGAPGATTLRLCFSALVLCLVFRPWRVRLDAAARRSILIYGLSVGGMNTLLYLAIDRIPLGIAVALEFTGPLAVALWTSRRPLDFVWLLLAAGGLLLLLPTHQLSAGLDPLGVAYALGAGVCWFLYIIFGQKSGAAVSGGAAIAWGMAVGALLVLPLGIATAGRQLLEPSVLPIGLAVALVTSVIPYSLEMVVLRRLPAKTFSILMSLEPALGALSGFLVLREALTATQTLAILCIITASLGSTLLAKPTPPPTPEVVN